MTSEARVDGETTYGAAHLRILDAATSEFAEYGFAGSRVVRIAESARCNKQLIYHYFGDKLGLHDAVQRRLVNRSKASIEHERAQGLPFIAARLFEGQDFNGRVEWARLQLWDGLSGVVGSDHVNSMRSDVFELLRDWIRSDQDAGLVTSELTVDQILMLVIVVRLVPIALPDMFRLMLGRDVSLEGQQPLFALVRKFLQPGSAHKN